MNKYLVLISLSLLVGVSNKSHAQKKDYPTYETVYTTSDFESYWVFGTSLNSHRTRDSDFPILDLSAGWVFNNKMMLGLSAGMGLVSKYNRMNQVELYFDRMIRPNKAIHPILSFSGGFSRLYDNTFYSGLDFRSFYTLNPMMGVQLNLKDRLKMDFRIGYNFMVDTAKPQFEISENEIDSFTFSARILFGKFASFGN